MCSDEMNHQEVFSYYGRNDQNPANTQETFNLRMTTILSYTKPVKANTLMGVTTGAYASKMVTYDPVRKIHEEGYGVVGSYIYEIAGQKELETSLMARDENFPLRIVIKIK